MNCDLLIIGAGAAGLFAACRAAEAGLRAVVMERRHRPGLKLLMCANNRCNFGHVGTAEELLKAYGEPVSSFLAPAVRAFPSTAMARWLESLGVPVKRSGQRFYPASEKGDDVLHAMTDCLREAQIPIIYNCSAEKIETVKAGGFRVLTSNLSLECRRLLLAVGGCSYPRTGSTGDGMLFAQSLGLETEAPRAGLVGIQCEEGDPLNLGREPLELETITVCADGTPVFEGNLIIEDGILRGSAVYDLTRWLSRQRLPLANLQIDLLPERSLESLKKRWEMLCERHGNDDVLKLNGLGLPQRLARSFARYRDFPLDAIKSYPVQGCGMRPLREAIVTIGGIALKEFSPDSMECRTIPGLYAAGECLDIDGPTGGYNLEAAFATANLAIRDMAKKR